MDRRGLLAFALLCCGLLTGGCIPSLGGLAAAADSGGEDRTTVVNPTLALTGPAAFVASSTVSLSATTTPPGQSLEARLDGGDYHAVGSSWQHTGLDEGEHTVRVRVQGAASSEQQATFTVDSTTPNAPTGVSVTASAAGELAVAWTAGSDAGSGLQTYTIAYGTDADAPSATSSNPAPATSTTLTGVSSCQTYYVTVTCTDRAGNSSAATVAVACRANCGGDGTFTTTLLPLGTGPSTVARSDFDGDGIQDLAIDADETLQILLGGGSGGRGDGTFHAGTSYATGSTIAEIVAADVDQDRILDLVLVNETQLRVYQGQGSAGRGDGTFTLLSSTSSHLTTPQALLVHDCNADGIRDVIVGDWGGDTLEVFTGNGSGGRGTGAFTWFTSINTGERPGAIATGDFDANGITDLAVACQGGGEALVTHLGQGSGGRGNATFAAQQTWVSGGFVAGDVLVTDHNGDGIDDLVCTLALANAVCFLAGSGSGGRGTGTFYLDEVVGTGTRPWGLVRGDFTGDQLADYVALSYLQAGATLITSSGAHGRGDGTFTTSTAGAVGTTLFRGTAFDADGNGSLDLIAGDLAGQLVVLLAEGRTGIGDGTFTDRGQDLWCLGTAFGVTIADLTSDQVPDLLVASYYTPTSGGADFITTFLGDEALGRGLGTFTVGGQTTVGTGPTAFACGDFDRNRITDAAVLASDLDQRGGGDLVSILLGTGSNGVGDGGLGSSSSVAVGTSPRAIVAGDWNADAILDLAVANHAGNTVTILLGQGSGGRGNGAFSAQSPIAVGTGPYAITAGDWNSDGIQDLAVGRIDGGGAGGLTILLGGGSGGRGDGTFAVGSSLASTFGITGVTCGDCNGDGIPDLVAALHRLSGPLTSSGVVLYAGNGSGGRGDGTFTAGSEVAIGGNPLAIASGDWNGDGVLDVAVTRADAAAVAVLLGGGTEGRGDGTFGAPSSVGIAAVAVAIAAADFDADGVVDVVAVGQDRVSLRYGSGDY